MIDFALGEKPTHYVHQKATFEEDFYQICEWRKKSEPDVFV